MTERGSLKNEPRFISRVQTGLGQRGSVVECGSLYRFVAVPPWPIHSKRHMHSVTHEESARGLAQSKIWRKFRLASDNAEASVGCELKP